MSVKKIRKHSESVGRMSTEQISAGIAGGRIPLKDLCPCKKCHATLNGALTKCEGAAQKGNKEKAALAVAIRARITELWG